MSRAGTERRAERLVRCYPRRWRARYGDEFCQLLVDELTDEPRSVTRALDIVVHGLWTRLTYSGLAGSVGDPRRRLGVMFGALAAVTGVFLTLAVAVWSQLTVGWQWSDPANPGTREAVWLMSGALFALGAVVVLTVLPLGAALVVQLRRRHPPALWRASFVALTAAVVLCLGCDHFGSHWPGAGGHAWSGRGLIPAGIARFGWAGTLWITSYWAHPAALRAFPATEVVWMLLSPTAWLALLVSGTAIVRRLVLEPWLARWMALMFAATVAVMTGFLVGAVVWVSSDRPGPRNLFAVGNIDLAIIALLGGGLILGTHLTHRVISASARPATG